jgi:hypothetical protein
VNDKKKGIQRPGGRKNPLANVGSALTYVADRRGIGHFSALARGAGVGASFSSTMRQLFRLERWLTSSRNQTWLKTAGGEWLAWSAGYFRLRSAESGAPAAPSGGLPKDVLDLVLHAQQVHALSNKVFSRFKTDPRVRTLAIGCCNELNMLTAFATREARAAGIQELTATELAALAVWTNAEKPTVSLEERDRRVDKFRKVLDNLSRIDSALDELASL